MRVNVPGLEEGLVVRADGDVELYHGDKVYVSPQDDSKIYKFDKDDQAI